MRMTFLLVFLGALAACNGESPQPRNTPSRPRSFVVDEDPASDATQVREQIFRTLLRSHPKESPAFLSYGQGQRSGYSSAGPVILQKLADLGMRLLPASEANVPGLGVGGPVLHVKNGEVGVLYVAKITRWIDKDTAEVAGLRYNTAVAASGFSGTAKRLPGNLWRIDQYDPW